MKAFKDISGPLLLWILLFMFVLFFTLIFLMHFSYNGLMDQLIVMSDVSTGTINTSGLMIWLGVVKEKVIVFGLPSSLLFLITGSLLLKIILGRSIKKRLPQQVKEQRHRMDKQKTSISEAPIEKIVYRVDKHKEKRLYAHLLSVFQREGRLVDFLFEKLDAYEDDQIGAAVRNIHEQCKKVMDRHLHLKPVLDKREGEMYNVKEGFDSTMIRLVGNVKGEPPFEGLVRHRGWQIAKLNIPDLTGDDDSGILEPAEIEIQ